MPTTPTFAFRYPAGSDAPNGPQAFQNLAEDVEAQIGRTRYARVLADVSKTNSTALSDVTGLSFSLAANAEYVLDGLLTWYSLTGVDLKVAFSGPTGMTVSWSVLGPPQSNTVVAGVTDWVVLEVYGDANPLGLNTDSAFAMGCTPHGYFKTTSSGTLQLRFAQLNANASPASIKRGSWLRLHRIA